MDGHLQEKNLPFQKSDDMREEKEGVGGRMGDPADKNWGDQLGRRMGAKGRLEAVCVLK